MAIVRNIKTNDLYEYLGGNKFLNLRTGQHGEVSDEAAKKTFKINIDATLIINEFPIVKDLIKTLNLKIEKNERQ
jgi:hypothetical protein